MDDFKEAIGAEVPLESVLCTEQLEQRPSRPPDYRAEIQALLALVRELKNAPRNVLQRLVDTALKLCRGHSAGISLLEEGPPGHLSPTGDHFRWHAVAGQWAPLIWNTTTRRDNGPCGTVLDRNCTLLFANAHRHYSQFAGVQPLLIEALLVPFHVDGKAVGTVWIVAHDDSRKFDAEDRRLLESLATFAATAYQVLVNLNAFKQQAETLSESNQRFQLAVDAAQLGDWNWDAATDQVTLGPRAARMFGLPAGIPVTRARMRELLHPEDAERVRKALDEALPERTDYGVEYRVNRPAGGQCWIAASGRGRYAEDGTVLGMTGVMQDISERKRAEVVAARLAAIVESSDDAVIGKDLRGIVTSWNRGAEKIFGFPASEIIGQPVTRLIPPQRQVEEETILGQIARGESVRHFETVRLRKDGGTVDVSIAVSAIKDAAGRIVGASKVARDITERKRLDQVLQEKNAELESARSVAEKANRAKTDFLAGMSHELRTPLNAILGFAQLMESGSSQPTPSQKQKLDQILKAGWYLLELINEILDLALIESGKMTLSREPVSLAEVMLECRDMIEPQAHKRGIGMAFPRFDIPSFVKADRTRVKQVLINLLFNAIKYNKPGGAVAVECTLSPPDSIRISVRDTGAGLAPEQLALLFEPFNRLGKEASAEEGTGLGLVVTKRLVELMGGAIGVESTVGVGSVFWIELNLTAEPQPAAAAAEPKVVAQAQVQADAPLRTLLYVEEDPANLMLVEDLIARRPDIRLLSARDGNRGVEIARASRPDVILMDINLPGVSGIQALKILRADSATAHIPVVALSSNAISRDIEKCLAAGFFRYLTKPIKLNEFMDTLDVALEFAKTAAQTIAGPRK